MGISRAAEDPEWLRNLISDVAECYVPLGFLSELGYRYLEKSEPKNKTGKFVIATYVTPYELSGGQHDGARALSSFAFDVSKLLSFFSNIETLEWQVHRGYTDGLSGPEICIEGDYNGKHPVQLHLYADPPEDEAPSLVLDTTTNSLRTKTGPG